MTRKSLSPAALFALLLAIVATFGLRAAEPDALPLVSGVFTDDMVLQRDTPAPVWGWTNPGATVTVKFAGQTKTAKAGADGKWLVTLDPLPAAVVPM